MFSKLCLINNCPNWNDYLDANDLLGMIDIFNMSKENAQSEYYSLCKTVPFLNKNDDNYESIFKTSLDPENYNKNRYENILANESTLVTLNNGNYINANYIFDKKYISTQAPITQTIDDFWSMVWQQESQVIVMLTNYIEKHMVKADPYFSHHHKQIYGDFCVTTINVQKLSGIIITKLSLVYGEQSRIVHHLHYTEWPDFGIPESTKCMRTLVSLTQILQKSNEKFVSKPIICHCSAGVGRSGTFITIYQQIKSFYSGINKSQISISENVSCIRKERNGMIQTDDQYYFIYLTIYDWIKQQIKITNTFNTLHKRKSKSKSLCSLPSHINNANNLSNQKSLQNHTLSMSSDIILCKC